MTDTTKEIKAKYARLKADQNDYNSRGDQIDSGRFNDYGTNTKDFDAFLNNYAERWYKNDKPTQSLFLESAQQTLNDEDLMRKLRREYRQERRDFRRRERDDYRKRKDIYKKRHAIWEENQSKYTSNETEPEELKRYSFYKSNNAGRAQRLGGRKYRDAYLAFRNAKDAIDEYIDNNDMSYQINGGWSANDKYGVIEYENAVAQDYLDKNRRWIEAGYPYFVKKAELAAKLQDEADLNAAEAKRDRDATQYAINEYSKLLDEAMRSGQPINEISFEPKDYTSKYKSEHPAPTLKHKGIRYTKEDGTLEDVKARISKLYPKGFDYRYIAAMATDPNDPHGVYDETTQTVRPYTKEELQNKYGQWVYWNYINNNPYYYTPEGRKMRDLHIMPTDSSALPEHYLFPNSGVAVPEDYDGSWMQQGNHDTSNGRSNARGGKLRAPTRDKYGNKIARADNLSTRDYDVYF